MIKLIIYSAHYALANMLQYMTLVAYNIQLQAYCNLCEGLLFAECSSDFANIN